ncbi:Wadjet anti-phage system protein JetA family protein [Desulfocucumis palustris]|uniref:Wadjet anti-phage system protein JetA family protein n=1 Tax=Desulfocucumis palustris TaxID=1898651 RepID=UPI000CE9F381|nr:Wadjet anti-phage system protein JetA family protein [Desulfocucumis palustris]
MHLFDLVPERFFSVLTSKNKYIYLEALMVIHKYYRQELLMRKADLISMFVHHLEDRMMNLTEDEGDEPIGDKNLSGRAHFLLRKFIATGWLEKEYYINSFEEYLVVPDYAADLLGLLDSATDESPCEYNSLVYSTYSCLNTADAERDDFMLEALLQSHGATEKLKESLKRLYNNMRRYYQRLQDKEEIREIMKEHFDNYQVLILDRVYHPLKTFDSIPRYKTRILRILRSWLTDLRVIEQLAGLMFRKGYRVRLDDARTDVIRMLGEIIDTYENMETLLREIDKKNASYTRASVERTRYLLNADRGARGKLVEVLKRLPGLSGRLPGETMEFLQNGINLYRQSFLDGYSLFRERQKKSAGEGQPLSATPSAQRQQMEREFFSFEQRLRGSLTHQRIIDFIGDYLRERQTVGSREFKLEETGDFVKLILAVLKNSEEDVPYRVEFLDGYVYVNGYRIPDMIFTTVKGEVS